MSRALFACVVATLACAAIPASAPPATLPAPPAVAHEATLDEALVTGVVDWLEGRSDSWPAPDLIVRVRREAGGARPEAFPAWVRPTVLRLRGDADAGRAELLAAIEPGAEAPPAARYVLAFEHAALGEHDAAQALLADGEGRTAELARAAAARIRGDGAGEAAALLRVASMAGGAEAMARGGLGESLPRTGWEQRDRAFVIAARGRPVLPPGCADDPNLFNELRRTRTAAAAQAWVENAPCRYPALVSEFSRAGDAPGAQRWAEAWLTLEPASLDAAWAAALAAVHAGDAPRALLFTARLEDAARPESRGLASARLARALRGVGLAVPAIGAARQAAALAVGDARADAYAEVVAAQLAAGREGDARTTWAAADLSAAARAEAARAIVLDGIKPPAWLTVTAAGPGDVAAVLAGVIPLDEGLRWHPGSVVLLERGLRARALLLIGRTDETARGRAALEAFVRLTANRDILDEARVLPR